MYTRIMLPARAVCLFHDICCNIQFHFSNVRNFRSRYQRCDESVRISYSHACMYLHIILVLRVFITSLESNTRKYKNAKRLLEKGEQLTLDEAIYIAMTYEATQS